MNRFAPPILLERAVRKQGGISPGDSATVRLEPALLHFLMTSDETTGTPPGRGIHPMTGIPLGLAVEAAIRAAGGKENGIDVLRACRCSFESPVEPGEALKAHGVVVRLGERSVEVAAEVSTCADGRRILEAVLTLVSVGDDGRAARLPG